MLGRDAVLLCLAAWLPGCGGCSESEEAVKLPMSGAGAAVIIGGEASAEGLIQAWYEVVASGESADLDLLVLSSEQDGKIFDCSQAEDPEHHATERLVIRERMDTEIGAANTGLVESGARYEWGRARAPQTVELDAGAESDGCVLLRDIKRHKVRSVMNRVDAQGESRQEMRLASAVEVDGGWFLAGVPGPLVPDVQVPVRMDPRKSAPIGPLKRTHAPVRIQAPKVSEPGKP
jgi:hypothetical protein